MRIGLLTDLHYCSQEVMLGRRYPQLALSRAQQAVQDFSRAGVERVVCLGDLIDAEEDVSQNERNLRAAASTLLSANVPCACVMGNHDCTVFAPEEFTRLSGLQIAPCSWVAGDVALHFLNANFDWQDADALAGRGTCARARRHGRHCAQTLLFPASVPGSWRGAAPYFAKRGGNQRAIANRTHCRRVSGALPSWLSQRAQWHSLCYIGCAVRGAGKQRHGHRYRCLSRLERRGPAMQYGHNNQKAQEVVYDLDKRRIFGAYDL